MSDAIYTTQDVVQQLVEILKAEGPVRLAQIPDKLKPIDYRAFTTGKLKTWLCAFPEFAVSEDGLSVALAGEEKPSPAQAPAPAPAPIQPPTVIPEVRCMHNFAYMNFWNQNLKRLRTLGEFSGLKADALRDLMGRQLMQRLLLGQISVIVSDDQQPSLVLDTGLQIQDDQAVYAVLGINPVRSDDARRPWIMTGFCSNAESDTSELGQWLREQTGNGLSLDHTDLQEQLETIIAQTDEIRAATKCFLRSLEEGRCPDLSGENRLSQLLAQYEARWESLLAFLEDYPGISPEDTMSIPGLRAAASQESFRNRLLRQALELFETVATGTQAFFREYGWEAGEDCTPLQDLAALQTACNRALADNSITEEFRRILGFYRAFRNALSATKADEDYYANVTTATEHFRELPQFRMAAKLLRGAPVEERAFLDGIENIESLLRQYFAADATADDAPALPESNLELLHLALQADNAYVYTWPQYLKAALPEEPSARQAVVPGVQDPEAERTCFAAANRLQLAGYPVYAERYWILGLLFEQAQCAPQLLKYYRETNQEEAFALIWSRFHEQIAYSPQDETFWFSTVCQQDPDQAIRMGQDNIHLQYQPDYLANLIPAAQRLGQTELAETFRLRLERFRAQPQPNPFEAAVIADDRERILALALPESLGAMGYTAQQIQTIRNVLEADEYPAGTNPFDIGSRIYAFQGNLHSLAEQWLWQGVSKQNRGSYGVLLLLLTNERRWDETIALYFQHAESQKRFEDCRRLYLIACYYHSPAKAQGVILENLQDTLSILNTIPSFRERFNVTAQQEGLELYALLLKLHATTSAHPYLWSVICEDRSLRDQVGDATQLSAMGLDVAVTGETYRSGNYPHGRDAASIAHRLYALAGNYAGAAEIAARMDEKDPSVRKLLWSIYQQQKNEAALYALLSEDAALQKEHYAQYMSLLFARSEFETFLTLLDESGDFSEQLLLQRAIAELTLGKTLTDSAEVCAEAAASCSPELCLKLLRAAADQEKLAAEVIGTCFEQWFSLPAQQLQALVTCDGRATAQRLEQLQTIALQQQNTLLAVYLYNVLKIGNAECASQQLYQQLLEELNASDQSRQTAYLKKLQTLYPDRTDELSAHAVSMSIRSILLPDQDADPQQILEKLAESVASLKNNPAALDPLLRVLRGSEYCRKPQVYTAIGSYAKQIGRTTDALLFLHGERGEGGSDPQFQDHLLRLYWNALVESCFPQQIAAEAEEICFQTMEDKGSVIATLNIAMLRQLAEQPAYAYAVLRHLAEATNSQDNLALYLSNALGMDQLPDALQLPNPLPDPLQLFEQILNQGSAENVLHYLAFCQRFVDPAPVLPQALQNMLESPELTEQQSIQAIQLLCSGPKRREFWELCSHIPFNVGEAGKATFLKLYCLNVPGHQIEYVQFCEKLAAEPNRLSDALLDWCQTSNKRDHEAFRQYLEEKLENDPSYLENMNDPENMIQIVQTLCDRVKLSKELLHAQVHAVTKIAVLSGNSTCLEILRKELGHLLLGIKGDLGVSALCKLLLADRFDEANTWLNQLHDSVARLSCRPLVEKLAGYSDEERRDWVHDPTNRIHLNLFLPNGTPPAYDRLDQLVCSAVLENREGEAVAILRQHLEMFPSDYATAYELFTLCRFNAYENLSVLHSSLVALAKLAVNPDNQENAARHNDCDAQTLHAMLAILNQLIIYDQSMNTIQDGWDFKRSTARVLADRNIVNLDPAKITNIEQAVQDSLAFQSPEIAALRVQAWIANITGNWTPYLRQAFRSQTSERVFFPDEAVAYMGFAQSILQLISRTAEDDIPRLLDWLEKLPLKEDGPDHWNRQRSWALAFYRKGSLTQLLQENKELTEQLLFFPIENGRLCDQLISAVSEQILAAAPDRLYTLATMLAFLGGRYTIFTVYTLGNRCFKHSQDGAAWALFSALYRVSDLWNCSHSLNGDFSTLTPPKAFHIDREDYQSKLRISGAFCGDEACLAKLADPNMSPWTNINLIIAMASARPQGIGRLLDQMHPNCIPFSRQVIKILNRNVSDEEKLAILGDPSFTMLQRNYLSQMLCYTSAHCPHYLKSEDARKEAVALNDSIFRSYTAGKPDLKKLCQKPMMYRHQRALNLRDPYDSATNSPAQQPNPVPSQHQPEQKTDAIVVGAPEAPVSVPQNRVEFVVPDYMAHLTPLGPDPQALLDLQKQYRHPNSTAARAEISQQIYRYVLAAYDNPAKCYCALIQYGVDQFYALYRDTELSSRRQAFQLLLSLLETDNYNVQSGPEYEALVKLVNEVGATGLILSCSKIQDLAQLYVARIKAFKKLRRMVKDKMVFENMGVLYTALYQLQQAYEHFGGNNTDQLIYALNNANRQIRGMSKHGDIKFHLHRILDAEISSLSRCAILEVSLLNQGTQPHNGVLSGYITNKGLLQAETVTLQAFCNTFVSQPYVLKQLPPGEKAIFEIPYVCDPADRKLEGHLSVTEGSGETQVGTHCDISLVLGATSGNSLPFSAYPTDRTAFVYDEKTGTVHNNSFFGRSTETARLRELVAGDCFADFHSAIVYGVRRTGKTYLLEYFKTYVQHTHSECLCIRIDAQGSNVTIHSVFIQRVLDDRLVSTVLNTCGNEDEDKDVAAFRQKWESYAVDDGEMDPNLIKVFFRELYELTGKGLFLLIDETDRLLQQLVDNHEEKILNNLLQALSSLLDDDERKQYLQLVICGSNWLMHYASVGRDMQQLFQRVGDYKISVGRLPKEDVLEVLRSVNIPYAEGTQEMIWEFTGGLVWFVKLLANAAIRRAKDARRNHVYPADVFYSLPTVVNRQNCDQFYEGCLPGSVERQMIDAMQSLAYRKDRYLSLSEVGKLLDLDTPVVEKALGQLIYFEIVERHPTDPNRVRFALDIYRRFFRSLYSVYPRTPEEDLVFALKNDSGSNITYNAGDNVYADDDEL